MAIEPLNVKRFGARGDGVTDDTAAIQAAVAQSQSTGLPITGVGTFKISGLITVTGNARFDMPYGTLKQADGANLATMVTMETTGTVGSSSAAWQTLRIDGNKANNTTAVTGLKLTNTARGRTFRVFAESCDVGMEVNGTVESSVVHLGANNCGQGLLLASTGATSDEMLYYVSGHDNDTVVRVDAGADQLTGRIYINTEITTNHAFHISGRFQGSIGGIARGTGTAGSTECVLIEEDTAAAPTITFDNLHVMGSAEAGNWAVQISNCQTASGVIRISNVYNGVWAKDANARSSLQVICAGQLQGTALRVGETGVSQMAQLTIENGSMLNGGGDGTSPTVWFDNSQDCIVDSSAYFNGSASGVDVQWDDNSIDDTFIVHAREFAENFDITPASGSPTRPTLRFVGPMTAADMAAIASPWNGMVVEEFRPSGNAPSHGQMLYDESDSTWKNRMYKSGSGSPSGSVTPDYIGQEYLDTTGNAWYKAYGTGNTDWQAL